jgi:glycosyltransferase involved in cell wall biosynthesis
VAQHKKIEDLVALFQEYHNLDQDSCLLIVGTHLMPGYSAYLRHVLDTRFQRVKDSIFFLGEVSLGQLKSLYRACSAFVTMSEHEGFCLPVVEAMSFDLPVFAYAEPAVRETLGGSGVICYSKDFPVIAEDMHRILHSTNELAHMLASQRRRVGEIEHEANGYALWRAFEEVLFTK